MKIDNNLKRLLISVGLFIITIFSLRFLINSVLLEVFEIGKLLSLPESFKPFNSGSILRSVIVIVAAFVTINRERIRKIKLHTTKTLERVIFIVSAFVALTIYYLYRYVLNKHILFAEEYIWLFMPILYLLFASTPIFLGLAIFGRKYFVEIFKEFNKQLVYYVIAGVAIHFLAEWIQTLWLHFSSLIAAILYAVFSMMYSNVTLSSRPGGPLLGVEGFRASIGAPCSGIDSFFLFTGLFLFIFLLDFKKLNKWKMGVFFILGVVGMYFVNILRIFLLYLTGVYISPEFAVGLFHQNVGWIFFIIYFSIYWFVISKTVYIKDFNNGKKKNKPKNKK